LRLLRQVSKPSKKRSTILLCSLILFRATAVEPVEAGIDEIERKRQISAETALTNVNPHGLKRVTGSTVIENAAPIENAVPYKGSLQNLMTRRRAD